MLSLVASRSRYHVYAFVYAYVYVHIEASPDHQAQYSLWLYLL